MQRLQYRVLWPEDRTLHVRDQRTAIEPTVRPVGGMREYAWGVDDAAAVIDEEDTPAWYDDVPAVQLSEFAGWGDVVAWASPLFHPASPVSPALARAPIEAWRAHTGPRAQAPRGAPVRPGRRALPRHRARPVLAPSSTPSDVFARRFGDCKDKALLLSTALNALGIEAYPALVNTDAGTAIDAWQPSPFAFNHAIVQAKLGGATYWLDGTMGLQRGGLGQYYDPSYRRALVIRDGATGLEPIVAHGRYAHNRRSRGLHGCRKWEAPSSRPRRRAGASTPTLDMRYELTQHSMKELGKTFLNYYAAIDPTVEADGPPRVLDDPESNTLTITERYTIRSFWKNAGRRLVADRIGDELDTPRISRRSAPLAISSRST